MSHSFVFITNALWFAMEHLNSNIARVESKLYNAVHQVRCNVVADNGAVQSAARDSL